ncbi:MAG: S8 family serine peptidase [Aquificae bacterium]|nr:S8 family serine peptidase [Aquificota bacterium]
MRKALLACALVGFSFGKEYILKGELSPELLPFLKKKLGEGVYLLELPEGKLSLLSNRKDFVLEENRKLRALGVPNDTCYGLKWGLEFIGAQRAWDVSVGGADVYVALFDTGVDYNHPDIRDNLWRNPGEVCYNGVDDDNNGYVDDCYGVNVLCYPNGSYNPFAPGCNAPDALDNEGHGTFLAGIIGAVGNNAYLIPGVAWRVKIIPCKFLGRAGEGDIAGEIACFEYIRSIERKYGIRVVALNASYGGEYPPSDIQREYIANFGGVYVTASGNSGQNNDIIDFYPCNYNLPNEVCVGAHDKAGAPADFSHYGFNTVHMFAPGVDIVSLLLGRYADTCDSSLGIASGTSMSAPFVTGALALLFAKNPSLDPLSARKELLLTGKNSPLYDGLSYTCNVLELYNLLTGESSQKLCASSRSLDFGSLPAGEESTLSLSIRSTGKEPLEVRNVYVQGEGFGVASEDCTSRALPPFSECTVIVSFRPQREGTFNGNLIIEFGGGERVIELSGYGLYNPFYTPPQTTPEKSPQTDNQVPVNEPVEEPVVDTNPAQPVAEPVSGGGGGGCNTGNSILLALIPLLKLLRRFK